MLKNFRALSSNCVIRQYIPDRDSSFKEGCKLDILMYSY